MPRSSSLNAKDLVEDIRSEVRKALELNTNLLDSLVNKDFEDAGVNSSEREKAPSLADLPFEPEPLSQEELTLTHEYDGMTFPPAVRPEALTALKTFEIRSDDILVATYPKSGTHWMCEIVGLLLADGISDKVNRFSNFCHIEFSVLNDDVTLGKGDAKQCLFYKVLNDIPSPRLMSSHLRTRFLPPQVFEKKTKIIYVARNPKDAFTSYYHFLKKDHRFGDAPWEYYFQGAITGKFVFGPWFDHVLEYWNMKDQENVLFLKYEDIKKNPRDAVIAVAKHLNISPSEGVLDKVVELSSLDEMKKMYKRLETESGQQLGKNYGKAYGAHGYVRKGVVGDWKNHFTVAQNEEFDKVFKEKLAGSGLTFDLE